MIDSKQFRKKMKILIETEKELMKNLEDDDLERFEKYSEAWSYINAESDRDSFKMGFKIGAKLVFDIFAD